MLKSETIWRGKWRESVGNEPIIFPLLMGKDKEVIIPRIQYILIKVKAQHVAY